MLFKEYCSLHYYKNRAKQGMGIKSKSSYCKDHANQGRVNQGPAVLPNIIFRNIFVPISLLLLLL